VSPTAIFFARVSDPSQIQRVEFYAQDVQFLKDLGYSVRIVTRVRDLLRARPADLYFCWWWTWAAVPVALARALRRSVVITGTFNHHLFDDRPVRQRQLIRFAARHASANIFVSQIERDHVAEMLEVHNPSVSPHTVDVGRYRPLEGGIVARDKQLLLTSCLMHNGNSIRKCVAEAIRAFALLAAHAPRLRLIVLGQRGNDYPDLARLADALGVGEKVEFPGMVSQEEKIRLMQRCGIYLQPSRFEGFGVAGLEAMACGAPVVTSPVGAVPEVGGDAVVYVDGTDPTALAAAIRTLLQDEKGRQDYGRAARERAVALFSPARRRHDLANVLKALT
jgi:glycosyltransferase involved in cell wall biosynthesis